MNEHLEPAQAEESLLQESAQESAAERTEEALLRQLIEDAEDLRRQYTDFDLEAALDNEAFSGFLLQGLSMRQAYELSHAEQIFQNRLAAEKQKWQAEQLAMQARVGEAAAESKGGGEGVADMSRKQREEIARCVSRGEIITL